VRDFSGWSTADLFAAAAAGDDEVASDAVSEVHRRGGAEEVRAALAALTDMRPAARRFGADVLGKFGYETPLLERLFRAPSIVALVEALTVETDQETITSIAMALCWLQAEEAVDRLLELCRHPNEYLRCDLAIMLPYFGPDHPRTVAAVEDLLLDPAPLVRDWASFAFTNELAGADSPRLRERLLTLTTDPDRVTAAQAIHALAIRNDRRALPALVEALTGPLDDATYSLFQAAQLLPDRSLVPGLSHMLTLPDWEDTPELIRMIVILMAPPRHPA